MRTDPGNEQSDLPTAAEGRGATAFDQVISPLSRDEFLSKYWRQSFVRISGQKGRFASWLPWGDLNHILEHQRLKLPLLRLFRDGKPVDPLRYFGFQNGIHRLKPASLVNCLSEGATLILDGLQDLTPTVRAVAEALEDALHAKTTVNLYASWRTQKAFDLHWDYDDTMILQVSGRKQWKVYQPTRLHPLLGEEIPEPTDEPIWEGVLEDGDMMYMPRGWWHVAFPLDEPSLHLTVTIVPANGTDLLHWFVDGLRRHAEVRMNVPEPASLAERKQYVSRIRELILAEWNENVLDRFLAEWNAIPMRSPIQLPFSPLECRAPITMETRIRLATTGQLSLHERNEGSVSFNANGVWWECAPGLVPALKLLSGTTSHSVQELCSEISDPTVTPKLIVFLTGLAMGGAIWIESRDVADDRS
jgi:ribosomal protein L16 Arg81 hydroxylase